jgi:uncharacterized protein (DUF433 family)
MGVNEKEFSMATDTSSIGTIYAHIVHTPGTLGGEARIDGHRIRVRDIVVARDRGALTPEEIVATVYPHLTLAQVYSALAYYEDHHREIEEAFESEQRLVEEFWISHPELVQDAMPKKE